MSVPAVLKALFEEQIEFRTNDGKAVDGSVFIGETEFLPVEILRDDQNAYEAEFERWYETDWRPKQQEMLDHLLEIHGNAKRYTDLSQAVNRKQVIPFVGSGMSALSGYPTWTELLLKFCEFTTIDSSELEHLLQNSAFEEAADLIASGTNSNLLNERVEHELRIDEPDSIDGAVRILPAIFPKLAITTNLDDLLEQIYGLCSQPFAQVLAGEELARFRQVKSNDDSLLLKLHGDCRHPNTRVLLSSEYEKSYAPGDTIREELTLLYRSNHLLFMGCSLGPDRTVQLIAEVSKADKNMPKHYCFLSLPPEEKKWVERENFLSEIGIYPIWYDGAHDECIMALLSGLLEG